MLILLRINSPILVSAPTALFLTVLLLARLYLSLCAKRHMLNAWEPIQITQKDSQFAKPTKSVVHVMPRLRPFRRPQQQTAPPLLRPQVQHHPLLQDQPLLPPALPPLPRPAMLLHLSAKSLPLEPLPLSSWQLSRSCFELARDDSSRVEWHEVILLRMVLDRISL